MARSSQDQSLLVEEALARHGIDLRSRVYLSSDPALLEVVRQLADTEAVIPGVTRRPVPLVSLSAAMYETQLRLEPGARVDWHCHKDQLVMHEVTLGHIILETLSRDQAGDLVRDANGELVRKQERLEAGEYWIAPPGEPYAYWAEEEPAATTYRHREDSRFPPAEKCVDPTAREEGVGDPPPRRT